MSWQDIEKATVTVLSRITSDSYDRRLARVATHETSVCGRHVKHITESSGFENVTTELLQLVHP